MEHDNSDRKREQARARVRGWVSELVITSRRISSNDHGKVEDVDQKIIPELRNLDEKDEVTRQLLVIDDDNPNVQDSLIKALIAVDSSDEELVCTAISKMVNTVDVNPNPMPVARAMQYLLSKLEDTDYSNIINATLNRFKERVKENGWRHVISDNFPDLRDWLKP